MAESARWQESRRGLEWAWRRSRPLRQGGRRSGLRSVVLALVVALPASGWAASHTAPPGSSLALVGNPAPDFLLPDDRGAPVRLAGLLGSQSLLLTFWSAACGECVEHLRNLEGIYQRHRAAGLLVLAINIDRAPVPLVGTALQETARDLGLSFPQLMDPRRMAAAAYTVGRLPTTILIDRRGLIREVLEGTAALTGSDWDAKVAALLR